ncbi:MAG: lamin tail domain-containing protein [Acidaminobacteraceae bacterium]
MTIKKYYQNGLSKVLIFAIASVLAITGCSTESISTDSSNNTNKTSIESSKLDVEKEIAGYKIIEVDGGDLSGRRESNVVVDIGFGDRKYYAFTNEYGQLVKVIAKEITLQDDSKENVLSTGRYFRDEAKVPGVESPTLDEGHVIADSLGGVSNAYNITPQESTLNRHGNQAYMEKAIRDANGCTDFVAIITYPDTKTQIPSHYSFTYTLKGNVINDEFDNVNPDQANAELNNSSSTEKVEVEKSDAKVRIIELDKKEEYIIIENDSNKKINLKDWKIVSVRGNQAFTFPSFILDSNSSVKVGDKEKNLDVDFHWLDGNGTWSNSDSDPAELYDNLGRVVDRFEDLK